MTLVVSVLVVFKKIIHLFNSTWEIFKKKERTETKNFTGGTKNVDLFCESSSALR